MTYSIPSEFGYHFCVGLSGPEMSAEEERLLTLIQPTAVILFGKNLRKDLTDWIGPLLSLLAQIRTCVNRPELLIAIDHEGGRVHRFFPPVTHFPAAAKWSVSAADVGRAFGRELRALGFNLDFAPVLDCVSEPLNTVIGDRALSTAYASVAAPAIEFAHALERQGVLSCGKHFPGHGGTVQDSHFELPRRDVSAVELEQTDLVPFQGYIAAQLPLLMTAHVVYPALDPSSPASLSKPIITGLLRGQLNYSGTVISDDLEMKALEQISIGERALQALLAGTDLLLEGNHKSISPAARAMEMIEYLARQIDGGKLPLELLNASRRRIDSLLNYSTALQNGAELADYPLSCIGSPEHQTLCTKLKSV